MYLVSLLITIFLPSSASFGSPPSEFSVALFHVAATCTVPAFLRLQLMTNALSETTNLSSISGDCAMISTTSPGRGAIKVLSNNRDPVYVTSFR